MKSYKAKEDCFVDNVFRKAGDAFEYEGVELSFLEELDEDGKPLKSNKGSKEAKAAPVAKPSKDAAHASKEAI